MSRMKKCVVCHKSFVEEALFPASLLRRELHDFLVARDIHLTKHSELCRKDMGVLRRQLARETLQAQHIKFTPVEEEVVKSFETRSLLSHDIEKLYDEKTSLGDCLSDKIVAWGGSWRFIICFAIILIVWIIMNSYALFMAPPFDPYPYILLNLVLSCVAAVQAPFIMMSQNRQEAKDRMRSEHDYTVNLKAELEIRHLQAKLDQHMHVTWDQLEEIRQNLEEKDDKPS